MVYATRGFDYTYALHPFSERRLLQEQPDVRLPSRITVAFDDQDAVEAMHDGVFRQAAPLLTGLTLTERVQFLLSARGSSVQVVDQAASLAAG